MSSDKNTVTMNIQDGDGKIIERHSIRLEYVTHISEKSGVLEIHMVGGKTITINDSSDGGMVDAFLKAWEMYITSQVPGNEQAPDKPEYMT